ncbi:acyltransferase family protein [Actinomadura hibisca]|uniref:acyltransferase family protein n=1 Tax=Actinomadura hibisca TaxID=68565 RepID=UPI000A075D47|nr:acyltransferase [Actinomadura hibisca]
MHSPAPTTTRSAVPQVSGHQDALDGVRAVAALAVLVFHVASNAGAIKAPDGAGWLYNGGQVGVAVFFVLSGLLLYRPWAAAVLTGRSAPRTGTYLLKRALRILPAYWAMLAVFFAVAAREHLADPASWAAITTLTHPYVPDPWWSGDLGPHHIGQIWSLAVEAAWYVLLPLTAALLAWYARRTGATDPATLARRLLYGLGGYASVSFLYTVVLFVPEHHRRIGVWPPRYFAWFALGMALAVLTVWARVDERGPAAALCRRVADSWGACWAAAGLLLVVAATPATGPLFLGEQPQFWPSQFHLLVNGLCALAFVAPAALAPVRAGGGMGGGTGDMVRTLLGNPVMRFLGRISYGLFLWQMLIIVVWFEESDRMGRGSVATDLPLLLAATIAAATAGYYLVEKPFQLLARRLGRAS